MSFQLDVELVKEQRSLSKYAGKLWSWKRLIEYLFHRGSLAVVISQNFILVIDNNPICYVYNIFSIFGSLFFKKINMSDSEVVPICKWSPTLSQFSRFKLLEGIQWNCVTNWICNFFCMYGTIALWSPIQTFKDLRDTVLLTITFTVS